MLWRVWDEFADRVQEANLCDIVWNLVWIIDKCDILNVYIFRYAISDVWLISLLLMTLSVYCFKYDIKAKLQSSGLI